MVAQNEKAVSHSVVACRFGFIAGEEGFLLILREDAGEQEERCQRWFLCWTMFRIPRLKVKSAR